LYTLDTNPIVYYVKREPSAMGILEEIFSKNAPRYISTISVIELFSPAMMAEQEKEGIEQLILSAFIIPVDLELAREAAELRAQYRLKTPDSAITATALLTRSTLVTRNIKDFQKVAGLRLLAI